MVNNGFTSIVLVLVDNQPKQALMCCDSCEAIEHHVRVVVFFVAICQGWNFLERQWFVKIIIIAATTSDGQ